MSERRMLMMLILATYLNPGFCRAVYRARRLDQLLAVVSRNRGVPLQDMREVSSDTRTTTAYRLQKPTLANLRKRNLRGTLYLSLVPNVST